MNQMLTSTLPQRRSLRITPQHSIFLILIALLVWSVAETGIFRRALVNPGGWSLAFRFVQAAFAPDLHSDLLVLAGQSMLVTLAYAVAGTTLALLIGMIGGICSSEAWWSAVLPRTGRIPWLAVRSAFTIPRAIHEVVWGLLLINLIGLDPLSAILALAIPFGAITAKVFAEILDEAPQQVLRALVASGATPLSALIYGLLPQALPDLLAYTFYRFECAIRSAAVLGLIGAGGLGYQVLLSNQSLRYDQMWTFLYALLLLSGLTDLWSAALRGRLRLSSRDDRCRPVAGSPIMLPEGDRLVRGSLLVALIAVPLAFWYLQPDIGRITAPRTSHLFHELVQSALPPRLDPGTLIELWQLATQTLAMSVLAMAAAGVGAALIAFPAAQRQHMDRASKGRLATGLVVGCRAILLLLRAIAEPIWALLALLVFFPGILPGAIGLAFYNLGIVGRLDAEIVENLDPRPAQALGAMGASRAQAFLYAELPLAFPRFVAYALYRWEVAIRATVIVGLVGAGGLGRLLGEQIAAFDYRGMTSTLLAFMLVTWVVDLVSMVIRRSLSTKAHA